MAFSRSFLVLSLSTATLGVALACSSDSEDQGGKRALSQRGESCQTRADCASGLTCVNETCTVSSFGVTPQPHQCAVVQCRAPEDCCPTQSTACPSLKAQCDGGDQLSCQQFTALCTCNFDCTDGACIQRCTTLGQTCTNGMRCNGTECVQCMCDTHCPATQVCRGQRCFPGCRVDRDCAALRRCQDGVCIEDGCTTDRECIAELSNVLAACVAGKCVVRCSSDIECDTATGFKFHACIDGTCQALGCETDDECRALMKLPAGSRSFAQCREPRPAPTPGAPPNPGDCATGGTGGALGAGGSLGFGGTGGSVGIGGSLGFGGTGGSVGTGGSFGIGGTGGSLGTGGTGGTSGTTGNCCVVHAGPSCTNTTIANCVCSTNPNCCLVSWDASCVSAVSLRACGTCTSATGGTGGI